MIFAGLFVIIMICVVYLYNRYMDLMHQSGWDVDLELKEDGSWEEKE